MAFIALAADLGRDGAGVSRNNIGYNGYNQSEKNLMRTVRQRYGETEKKGLHAILAKDCDACKVAIIGMTMEG
jgi:hypothetical protein